MNYVIYYSEGVFPKIKLNIESTKPNVVIETSYYRQKIRGKMCYFIPHNFKIHSSITSESSNLFYVIPCSGCGEQFIGQNVLSLRHRMTVHQQQVRETEYQSTAVSGHLRNCAKTYSGTTRVKTRPF